MCMVSAVIDSARGQIDFNMWNRPVFNEYLEIIRRLEELDKKIGLKDCVDDRKEQYLKEIEERLSRLEAANKGDSP